MGTRGFKIRIGPLYPYVHRKIGWLLIVLRIYVALAIIQPYCEMKAGDNQSLKL